MKMNDCKVTPMLVLFWWWWFQDTVLAPPIGRLDLTSSAAALNQRICSQSGDSKSSCSQSGDNLPLQSTCGLFCLLPVGSLWKTRQFCSHWKGPNCPALIQPSSASTIMDRGGDFHTVKRPKFNTSVLWVNTRKDRSLWNTTLPTYFSSLWPPCSLTLCDKQIICPYLFRNANMILCIAKKEVHICKEPE